MMVIHVCDEAKNCEYLTSSCLRWFVKILFQFLCVFVLVDNICYMSVIFQWF